MSSSESSVTFMPAETMNLQPRMGQKPQSLKGQRLCATGAKTLVG